MNMTYKVAVIPGDGIGPEVTDVALEVLELVGYKYNHTFETRNLLAGGVAIDEKGIALPEETLKGALDSDGVLLGAVGGPKWDHLSGDKRPEAALLGLRKGLGLYANLRPATLFDALKEASPLKASVLGEEGLDLLVMRELTGGIYFGERNQGDEEAYDTLAYSKKEIKRIAVKAFEAAMKRNKKVTSVDKANILDSSRLWRKVVDELATSYPEVEVNHLYVDNAAMQLVCNPKQFDVILTGNMFGDILSDEASMLTGSIGMLPSASMGDGSLGMYEPVHGSAPDIAGEDKANPLAMILSVAMMLRYSFDLEEEALAIEKAVTSVLDQGYRTGDIYEEGNTLVGTQAMGALVLEELKKEA